MTMILYTEAEGAFWIPLNTPVSKEQLVDILNQTRTYHRPNLLDGVCRIVDNHFCHRGNVMMFVPVSDVLPTLHSVLLETADRWDAYNRKWENVFKRNYFHWESKEEFEKWWDYYHTYNPRESHVEFECRMRSHMSWKDWGRDVVIGT